ncbi:MAG: hypothetical protein U1A27_00265 [Phycisphaerae bacterium]
MKSKTKGVCPQCAQELHEPDLKLLSTVAQMAIAGAIFTEKSSGRAYTLTGMGHGGELVLSLPGADSPRYLPLGCIDGFDVSYPQKEPTK